MSGHKISRLQHGLQLIMVRYTGIINCRLCCNLYILTATSACRLMFNGLSLTAALQSCVSYVVSDNLFHRPSMVVANCTVAARLRKCYFGWPARLPIHSSPVRFNDAAWSIAGFQRSDHVTDALFSFHWLPAPKRIKLTATHFHSVAIATPSVHRLQIRPIVHK